MTLALIIGTLAVTMFGSLIWLIISGAKKQAVAELTAKLERDATLKLDKANQIATAVGDTDSAERKLHDGNF